MKKSVLLILAIMVGSFTYSQTIIATTDDGKKVLLKADKSWEYLNPDAKEEEGCNLPEDFKEPKGKNTAGLRRIDATLDDLKEHVSVDNECNIEDVIVMRASEQKGSASYVLCVKGKKMKYRRAGSVFFREGQNPVGRF